MTAALVRAAIFSLGVSSFATTAAAQASAAPCVVADDATYGVTPQNPAQIGGGAMYAKARGLRYLDALRGPAGQAIAAKRVGSRPQATNSSTILDVYEVTYEGLDAPLTLFLDAYHFWEPRAPKGLTCGKPIELQPIPDAFLASDSLLAVALEQGATRDFDPIPIGPQHMAPRGGIWDGFRLLALASRRAAATGTPLTPASKPQGGTVIVAYPVACEGQAMAPTSLDLVASNGAVAPRTLVKDAELAQLLPGVTLPPGSIGARYPLQQIRPADRVKILYAEPLCPGNRGEVVLPLTFTETRGVEMPEPPLPEGANTEQNRVLLQVLVDLDGKLQRAVYAGGPSHLGQPAAEAVKTWRVEPAKVNGAPVPWATLVEVRFK